MTRLLVVPLFVGLLLHTTAGEVPPGTAQLAPTAHAPLPDDASALWLVPAAGDREARTTTAYRPLREGIAAYTAGDFAAAHKLLTARSLAGTALGQYAQYYAGLAELRMARVDAARQTLGALMDRKPEGYLGVATALAAAEGAEAAGDHAAALRIYERLVSDTATVNEEILSRLGRTALAVGDRKRAAEAWVRVYYEFPLTAAATEAGTELEALSDQITRTGYKADLGRAQRLFGARRYTEARAAFEALRGVATGDDRELVGLRIAECDFYLQRWAAARDGMQPYLDDASRKAEARFFYLSALRELGQHEAYEARTAALVADFPDSSWSEEALNNLGTHFILTNDDERAAQVFKDLYAKFPSGSRSERAAWKYGWWSYKTGDYAETIRVFESASETFPRSDYRPSFLYWAARAHGRTGAAPKAEARLRLVHADYGNSYYGRLAEKSLGRRGGPVTADHIVAAARPVPTTDSEPLPTETVIRLLLANDLYDDALNELRHAQREWGSNTAIEATIAWAYHRKGELRRAITLMRRAYPQHLTAGGQQLPTEILEVIFPLTYWDEIKRYSRPHGLDPYLIAALIAQESTFDPKIKSPANAWGLMQIVPATGRRLARSLGIRNFTTRSLTNPNINLRLGTLYFARLVKQFGGTHYALASYNAGENRVVRWRAERPGIDQDEFIDDIPFPETQNYVKRILGTAENYRMLYGDGDGKPLPVFGAMSSTTKPAPAVKKGTARKPAATPAKKPAAKKPAAKKPAAKKAGGSPAASSRR